jgi:putative membrane protein
MLAWIRTGLAMMGFGFVVARFGLFLHEIAVARGLTSPAGRGVSLWLGTALVGLGVTVDLTAAFAHVRTVRRLNEGQPLRFGVFSLGVIVAMLLGILGMLMIGYLLLGYPTP